MPRTFYMGDTAAPVAPNPSALWATNPSLVRKKALPYKTGTLPLTAEQSTTYVETAATTGNMIHRQFVSPRLEAGAISGTLQIVIRCAETDSAADASLQVHARVMNEAGTSSRGNLYTGHSAATNNTIGALGHEMSTAQQTRTMTMTLTSITAQEGDRIVVEIGHRYTNTSTASLGAYLTFGDPLDVADFTPNAGLTTNLVPWFRFSQNINFYERAVSLATTDGVQSSFSLVKATEIALNESIGETPNTLPVVRGAKAVLSSSEGAQSSFNVVRVAVSSFAVSAGAQTALTTRRSAVRALAASLGAGTTFGVSHAAKRVLGLSNGLRTSLVVRHTAQSALAAHAGARTTLKLVRVTSAPLSVSLGLRTSLVVRHTARLALVESSGMSTAPLTLTRTGRAGRDITLRIAEPSVRYSAGKPSTESFNNAA